MKTYYIVRVNSITTFYLAMPMGGEDALGRKLTPYVGNSYLFTARASAGIYAGIVESYGFRADICELGSKGSYGVWHEAQ